MRVFLFLSLTALLFSCRSDSYESPEAMSAYLTTSEDFAQLQEIDGHTIQVVYKPTDLLVYQEVSSLRQSDSIVSSLRKKYSRFHYFTLSLSKNGEEILRSAQANDTFSEMMRTVSFRMGSFVHLSSSNGSRLPVVDYSHSPGFGLSKSTDLLFAFERRGKEDSEWIEFNLKEFGLGIGDIRFRFDSDVLEHAPHLDFTN